MLHYKRYSLIKKAVNHSFFYDSDAAYWGMVAVSEERTGNDWPQ